MTFQEWADNLEFRASGGWKLAKPATAPWRCSACNCLMYGVEWNHGRQYPSPVNTPVGLSISHEYERVCQVCWELYHVLDERRYWKALAATDKTAHKKLSPGGNYFAT